MTEERSGSSLRIAMISYYLPSESKIGVGYQVHAVANELVRRGHTVHVFSSCGVSAGAEYTTLTVPLAGSNRTFKFALALRKLDFAGYDVLHAHGDDYWLWRRRCGAHVRTVHGSCFAEAARIHGLREKLRMFLLGCSELLASIVADRTVLVSANTRRYLPWVRTVIPNGVALDRFRPGTRSRHPSVLFVGTYERRKRGWLVAQAFKEFVLPRWPAAELWMVCEDAPPGDHITVLGRVSDAELARLYGSAWVFCLPSVYEGFGIPYIEAMAAGCAVLATPNVGAVEVTDGGRAGLLADAEHLGAALEGLIRDDARRQHLVRRARHWVEQYALDRVADAYVLLYQEVRAARAGHD